MYSINIKKLLNEKVEEVEIEIDGSVSPTLLLPEAAEGDDGAHDAIQAQAATAPGDVEGDQYGGLRLSGCAVQCPSSQPQPQPQPHVGGARAGVGGGEVLKAEALKRGGVLEVVDGGVAAVYERALPWRREPLVAGFRFRFQVQFISVQVDGEEVVGDGGDGRRPPRPTNPNR